MKSKKILNFTIIVLSLICLIITSAFAYSQEVNKELYDKFIRLHVIANSDSDIDQDVKLKVRDEMLKYMRENSINLENTDEAKTLIKTNLYELEKIASNVLKENGFDYKAKAMFGDFYFPTKEYEEFALPAGNYQALRIVLGNGEGHNWWCVMFPPLCFVDNSSAKKEEYRNEIASNLNEETYKVITSQNQNASVDIKFKFKIAEIFQEKKVEFAKR